MSEYVYKRERIANGVYTAESTGEEIVRCRDCVHYQQDPYQVDPGWPMYCEDTGRDMIEPNGYCAWAERRASK